MQVGWIWVKQGEEEDVGVAAGGQHHRVGGVGLQFAGDLVADDDPLGPAVHQYQVHHVPPGEHLDGARADLAREGRVAAQQQLLAGLAPGVEGAADLGPAEGAVVEVAAVFTGKGHALGHALVDDVVAHFGQAVDVGLPRAVVAALDRVVEQAEDRVAVPLVVLGRIDPALGGDGVGPPRRVLVAEAFDLVAQLGHGGRGRTAGQAGTDHDHTVFTFVGRVDQLVRELGVFPFLGDWPGGYFCIEFHCHLLTSPSRRARPAEPR